MKVRAAAAVLAVAIAQLAGAAALLASAGLLLLGAVVTPSCRDCPSGIGSVVAVGSHTAAGNCPMVMGMGLLERHMWARWATPITMGLGLMETTCERFAPGAERVILASHNEAANDLAVLAMAIAMYVLWTRGPAFRRMSVAEPVASTPAAN